MTASTKYLDRVIRTRAIGPDDYKGSRVRAVCGSRARTVPVDYSASNSQTRAAAELVGVDDDVLLYGGEVAGWKLWVIPADAYNTI